MVKKIMTDLVIPIMASIIGTLLCLWWLGII